MPLDARHAGQPGRFARSRWTRTAQVSLTLMLGLWLQACALRPAAPPVVVAVPCPPSTPVPVADPVPAAVPQQPTPAESPLDALLAAAERQRNLGPTELTAELARIGDPAHSPSLQMQLALLLLQTHQPADTARALGLLQRVAGSEAPEASPLRALARVLASRVQDVRRLEDQQERQNVQLRDAQKRIEVLNERLEAMRAIERSLGPRPTAPGNSRPTP